LPENLKQSHLKGAKGD
jgi:hypothetical protein